MDRTRALDRRHRRILGAGIAVSLAVHAAVLASVRFDVMPLHRDAAAALELLPPDALGTVWEKAPEIVQTRPTEVALHPLDFDVLGTSGAGGAPPPPRAAAPAGGVNSPVVPTGSLAFQEMVVIDPLTNGRTVPVSFGDLPEAAFTVAADSEDDLPVYVPGSVGRAKRNWANGAGAGNGTTGEGPGRGIGVVGVGGGLCPLPLPGRGPRQKPPVWKLATLRF